MRAEENELLTRVGPGTPMGSLMREYWMPVLKSEEVEAGGAPVRLRVLGENFIAFRSPNGDVGITDHRCAHRGASLFYGRNEEGGMRCVYHGWKFDKTGQCVEMPSEPPETDYKDRVKIKSPKTVEKYGVVWAYFGQKEEAPELPHFDIDKVPDGELDVSFMFRECNWLQALEGDIDTCHVGFLHLGGQKPEQFEKGSINYYRQQPENLAPKYEALETPYGTMYCAFRHAGPEETYHRVGQFAMPFWTMAPSEKLDHIRVRAWVPVDDHHSMLVVIGGKRELNTTKDSSGKVLPGAHVNIKYRPNTTDWYGRWRIEENPRNDHLIDREIQRTKNFTGIEGIPVQDQAVTESMGPIVDRTIEHLGTSDRMIMMTRRKMIRTAKTFAETGKIAEVDEPSVYRDVRAGFFLLPKDDDWLEEYNRYRQKWSDGEATDLGRTRAASGRQMSA